MGSISFWLQRIFLCAKKIKWGIKREFSVIFHLAEKFFRKAEMNKFNEEKTLSAILFLANQDGRIDLYALLKTLYYADKNHLHEWGRTITGDFYVRMKWGPVPSSSYDMLKSVRGSGCWETNLNLKEYFEFIDWTTIKPLKPADTNKLSETDVEALQKSFNERGHKSFPALKLEAHDDAAFKSKPNERIMTEEDLIEGDLILRMHLYENEENELFLKKWRHSPPFNKED